MEAKASFVVVTAVNYVVTPIELMLVRAARRSRSTCVHVCSRVLVRACSSLGLCTLATCSSAAAARCASQFM